MHHNPFDANSLHNESRLKRHFLDFLKKKKIKIRPGALTPDELRAVVNEIGKNKKVNIVRVEYDGTPEDRPVAVKIVDRIKFDQRKFVKFYAATLNERFPGRRP